MASSSIPLFDLDLREEDLEAVARVLRAGSLAAGAEVEAFEAAFAARLGVRHAVAVGSCTAALHLAYVGAGVGEGDEVIVPAYTFAATAAAAIYCGATPVFADVLGPHDLSLDVDAVRAAITPRTKAVTVVHFGGYAAPADDLRALCDEHGLALVEDTAHAPSASMPDGRPLGTVGMAGCFSFFSNKVLSCGEGGLLATDDDAVAASARAGRVATPSGGHPYAMDEPRAALLLSRLARLDDEVAARRRLTARYREALAGTAGVSVPYTDEDVTRSSCYVMPILLDDPAKQGPVRRALRENHGVQTSLLYPGTHQFTAYRERFGEPSLPRTEDASLREVTLPLFPHLPDADQDHVVAALREELAA